MTDHVASTLMRCSPTRVLAASDETIAAVHFDELRSVFGLPPISTLAQQQEYMIARSEFERTAIRCPLRIRRPT